MMDANDPQLAAQRMPWKRWLLIALGILAALYATLVIGSTYLRKHRVYSEIHRVGGAVYADEDASFFPRGFISKEFLLPLEKVQTVRVNSASLPLLFQNAELFREANNVGLELDSISDEDFSRLFLNGRNAVFKDIKYLFLGHTSIRDERLSILDCNPGLVTLEIEGNDISDAAVMRIAGLPDLKYLYLKSSRIPGALLRHIPGDHPLVRLDLTNTNVDDEALAQLRESILLEKLQLENTPVTDKGLVYLSRLKGLQSLRLDRTAVSDAGMVQIAKLTDLKHLSLISTQITDEGLMHLISLPHLESISVDITGVTGTGADEFRRLRRSKGRLYFSPERYPDLPRAN